jgi:hypothetical protein
MPLRNATSISDLCLAASFLFQLGDRRLEFVGRHHRMPSVAELDHPPEGLFALAANPD